jgi:hypothetical protein
VTIGRSVPLVGARRSYVNQKFLENEREYFAKGADKQSLVDFAHQFEASKNDLLVLVETWLCK